MKYISAATKQVIRKSFVIKLNTAERYQRPLIILVDRHMQTNIPGIYAAGDVAAATTSGGRADGSTGCALWPCAAEQGEVAGTNLAGCETSYQGSLKKSPALPGDTYNPYYGVS